MRLPVRLSDSQWKQELQKKNKLAKHREDRYADGRIGPAYSHNTPAHIQVHRDMCSRFAAQCATQLFNSMSSN